MQKGKDKPDFSNLINKFIRATLRSIWISSLPKYVSRPYLYLSIASTVGAVISIFFKGVYPVYFVIVAVLSFYLLLKIVNETRHSRSLDKDLTDGRNNSINTKTGEFERVLGTVFEVLIGLAIFQATIGILSPRFMEGVVMISSPIRVIQTSPATFCIYIVFILTSTQYLLGGSSHLRGVMYEASKSISFINYLLLIGQAIAILAMALSIVDYEVVLFSIWYISLIIIDILWLGTLVLPIHDVRDFFSDLWKVVKEDSEKKDSMIENRETIYKFWINGNLAYLSFLLIAEPLLYVKPLCFQYYDIIIAILLLSMTIISTFFANIMCLESLQAV